MRKTKTIHFISRAPIGIFKYSGVLPTIKLHINTVSKTYINKFMSPTPSPPNTTFSIINTIGPNPPKGVKLSCMLLTEPVVNAVVITVNSADKPAPNRTSLPSIFGP
ncbi:Uncharacterised protein [Staphylococcus aureus]|nr:Uncharacterised protein [Staphylococcus aureus]